MKISVQQLPLQLQKKIASLYLVSSNEPLLLQETCDLIYKQAKLQNFDEKISLQAGKNYNWQELAYVLNSSSLFSEKTYIEINIINKPDESGKIILQNYAQNPTENKILLIKTEKLDSSTQKTKWYKAIELSGTVIQIWSPKKTQFPAWLAQRMLGSGLTTDNDGIEMLANFTENNLLAAAQAIEILSLLYGNKNISSKEIADAIGNNTNYTIFDLADTCLLGKFSKAIKMLSDLKQEKIEPILILWAFTKEIRNLIQIQQAIEMGVTIAQACRKHGIWESRQPIISWALKKISLKELYSLLQKCATIDKIIKGVLIGNVWDELEKLCLLMQN